MLQSHVISASFYGATCRLLAGYRLFFSDLVHTCRAAAQKVKAPAPGSEL
jgi:hypothetical protein